MSSFDSEAFSAAGQSHLLQRLDQLDGAQAARFHRELEQLDLFGLQQLWNAEEPREDQAAPEPPVLVELTDHAVRTEALSQGQALLSEGKASVVLAWIDIKGESLGELLPVAVCILIS